MVRENICITVDRDELTGGLQISIGKENGGGYRLAGPKYCGMSKTLKKHILDKGDVDEIRRWLRMVPKS